MSEYCDRQMRHDVLVMSNSKSIKFSCSKIGIIIITKTWLPKIIHGSNWNSSFDQIHRGQLSHSGAQRVPGKLHIIVRKLIKQRPNFRLDFIDDCLLRIIKTFMDFTITLRIRRICHLE